ncbi:Nif3-like dinuclear metal center hexameric protein [Pedococcus bigeumensis]|uniref:GTP cyclohydrolase 1 type 2 homolog n=1 Tax=Pedococcus bigeumensis TaxID=433644 RepID=A0A502D6D1_9MICO|nr:Nif3-like dinuclear metal center hexameric protein [Pedococcus bigeumensis]TPG19646.1 Nif3-like dinuclear metal center hexameric protein [Pedococcus bigeumensis]
MHTTLADVVRVLEDLYPPLTAQSWDQVGLVSGDLAQPVRRIHFAVDPTLAVIEEARALGADLVVTHHPLLLRGIHSVATSGAKGATITSLVVNDIALYVAHTNADVASPGVNDALAEACGLTDVEPLAVVEGQPLGRVGQLTEPMTLAEFTASLYAALPPSPGGLRVAGPADARVQRVAVMGGAGDDMFDHVRASGADVYVTADLRHHPVLEAREQARGGPPYLVDAGHWATESLWLAGAAERVRTAVADGGEGAPKVETHISTLRTDPWDFVVGAEPPAGPGGTS